MTVGLLLMGNLSDSSGWTAPLPGQILSGIGIGLATPALASTAVGVVAPQLSGMASGANNTLASWGSPPGSPASARSSSRRSSRRSTPLIAGTPVSSHVHELARAVASGGTGRVLQAVPPAAHDKVVHGAHHAFVTSFNTIALVSVAVAAVASVAGYVLCGHGTSLAARRWLRRTRARRWLRRSPRGCTAARLRHVLQCALLSRYCKTAGRSTSTDQRPPCLARDPRPDNASLTSTPFRPAPQPQPAAEHPPSSGVHLRSDVAS